MTTTITQPSALKTVLSLPVIIAALGYFVDIYDLTLFSIVRLESLKDLGQADGALLDDGIFILNMQYYIVFLFERKYLYIISRY